VTIPPIRAAATALLALSLAHAPGCAGEAPAVRPDAAAAEEGPRPPRRAERAERAGKGERAEKGEKAAPAAPGAEAAEPAAEVSAKAQRLFGEAVKTLEDQKALKVPIDWPLMERKWRAVLSAGEVAEARFNLGVAVERQGRTAEAKAEYERALAAKPSLRQAKVNLAVLLEQAGDEQGASVAYAEVVAAFPEDSMARERLAALYRASGQSDEAWRLAREALLRDPKAIGAYKTMIRVAVQRKELDAAKLIALRAQKLDDKDAELAFLLADVLDKQGDAPAAAAQFAKVLELAPGNRIARYALLDQAVKKEAWPKVAEHAAALLADEPRSGPLTLLRGVALRHSDKPDEALAAYAKAEQLSGDRLPEVHLARGVLLMRERSECEPARVEFDKYVKAVGPILPKGSPVPGLQRECDEMIAANKAAAEAAKQMQAEAEKAAAADAARKAAEEAAKKPPEPAPAPAPPAATPAPGTAPKAPAPAPSTAPKAPQKPGAR
jgi:tetratricopeptide (TPR) repeat protein